MAVHPIGPAAAGPQPFVQGLSAPVSTAALFPILSPTTFSIVETMRTNFGGTIYGAFFGARRWLQGTYGSLCSRVGPHFRDVALRIGDVSMALDASGLENAAMLGSFAIGAMTLAGGGHALMANAAAAIGDPDDGAGSAPSDPDADFELMMYRLPEAAAERLRELDEGGQAALRSLCRNAGTGTMSGFLARLFDFECAFPGIVEKFFAAMQMAGSLAISDFLYESIREWGRDADVFGIVHQLIRTSDLIEYGIPVSDVEKEFCANGCTRMRYRYWKLDPVRRALVRDDDSARQRIEVDCYDRSARTAYEIKSMMSAIPAKVKGLVAQMGMTRSNSISVRGLDRREVFMAVQYFNQISRLGAAVRVGFFDAVEFHITSHRPMDENLVELICRFIPNVRIFLYNGLATRPADAVEVVGSERYRWVVDTSQGGRHYRRVGVGAAEYEDESPAMSDEMGFPVERLLSELVLPKPLMRQLRVFVHEMEEMSDRVHRHLSDSSLPGQLRGLAAVALAMKSQFESLHKPPKPMGERVAYVTKIYDLCKMLSSMREICFRMHEADAAFHELSAHVPPERVSPRIVVAARRVLERASFLAGDDAMDRNSMDVLERAIDDLAELLEAEVPDLDGDGELEPHSILDLFEPDASGDLSLYRSSWEDLTGSFVGLAREIEGTDGYRIFMGALSDRAIALRARLEPAIQGGARFTRADADAWSVDFSFIESTMRLTSSINSSLASIYEVLAADESIFERWMSEYDGLLASLNMLEHAFEGDGEGGITGRLEVLDREAAAFSHLLQHPQDAQPEPEMDGDALERTAVVMTLLIHPEYGLKRFGWQIRSDELTALAAWLSEDEAFAMMAANEDPIVRAAVSEELGRRLQIWRGRRGG